MSNYKIFTKKKKEKYFGLGKKIYKKPKSWSIKEEIDQLDFNKDKVFCSVKDTIKIRKRDYRLEEKYLANHVFHTGLIWTMYKYS